MSENQETQPDSRDQTAIERVKDRISKADPVAAKDILALVPDVPPLPGDEM